MLLILLVLSLLLTIINCNEDIRELKYYEGDRHTELSSRYRKGDNAVIRRRLTHTPSRRPTKPSRRRPTTRSKKTPTRVRSTNKPSVAPTIKPLQPSSSNSTSPSSNNTSPSSSTVKYVRIQHTQVSIINLVEVSLFYNNEQVPLSVVSNNDNTTYLALTAEMSSSWIDPTPVASHCIDGNIIEPCDSGNNCHPYICSTGGTDLDWLVVTVTGYDIDKIVVYNRFDAGLDRIKGANLIYSNDFEGSSVIYQSSFGNTTALIYTFDLKSEIPPVLTVPLEDYRSHYQLLYNSGTNSYDGDCRGEGWELKYPTNIGYTSIEDCAYRCDITPGCTGFNRFAGESQQCYLYYNLNLAAENDVPGNQCWKKFSNDSIQ